ncbi:hypothetical protein [Thermovibrio ammonificans]
MGSSHLFWLSHLKLGRLYRKLPARISFFKAFPRITLKSHLALASPLQKGGSSVAGSLCRPVRVVGKEVPAGGGKLSFYVGGASVSF